MIEDMENHIPQVSIIDEIGSEFEVYACRIFVERSFMLIGIAHGKNLENIIKNPTLRDLVCIEHLMANDVVSTISKGGNGIRKVGLSIGDVKRQRGSVI